ncbi:hypothetical protein MMC09_005860 [Bachmanniomyces sp. S44760]|nr:hypothetical protein [Bachmanniomyces sp. S44760]
MAAIPRKWITTLALVSFTLFFLWYLKSQIDVYAPPSLSNAAQPGLPELPEILWHPIPEQYPVKSMASLPTGTPQTQARLQHDFPKETDVERVKREGRQMAVKESFNHSWQGYKDTAWMQDELAPISGGYTTSFGGWAATLVDTLDTLWIMGMYEDLELAIRDAITIDFTTTESDVVNIFETTIRYLGGFLGAYDLSNAKYPELLTKAKELGEILYRAFDTPNRMPVTRCPWQGLGQTILGEAGENTLVAEAGSLTLEFTRLSQLTGDLKWFDAVQRITNVFDFHQSKTFLPGLWPVLFNAKASTFHDTFFTLGGMADSLYEYLPKQHMLLGGLTPQYQKMYTLAIDTAKKHLFFRAMTPKSSSSEDTSGKKPGGPEILFSGNARYNENNKAIQPDPQAQHLGCFTGGMLAMGAKLFNRPDDMAVARKLVNGCIWAYDSMPTGIMPETAHLTRCADAQDCEWDEMKWHAAVSLRQAPSSETENMSSEERVRHAIKQNRLPPGYADVGDRRYILRPEAIESLFILYRITGDKSLQDDAWRMFQAIEKATRTPRANAAIQDVTVPKGQDPQKANRMESFWLAETLKYFYLIFSEPDLVSLDEFVLNTEAHPFRRPV